MEKIGSLGGHVDSVLCCVDSREQGLLVTGGEDGRVCVYTSSSSGDGGQPRLSCTYTIGSPDQPIVSVAFDPIRPHTLYAAASSSIHVIDTRAAPSASSAVDALTSSSAAGNGSGSASTNGIVHTFSHSKDEINQVAVNSKGSHLAAADDSGYVMLVDLQARRLHKVVRAHDNICSGVAFRRHRPWDLVSGGMDQAVYRWDYSRPRITAAWSMQRPMEEGSSERQLFNPPLVHQLAVADVEERPWCQLVAVACGDGGVEVIDADVAPAAASPPQGAASSKGRAGSSKGGKASGKGAGSSGSSSSAAAISASTSSAPLPPQHRWLLGQDQGGHTRPASCVAFLVGGGGGGAQHQYHHLFSGAEDKRLLCWDLARLVTPCNGSSGNGRVDESSARQSAAGGPSSSACAAEGAESAGAGSGGSSASPLVLQVVHGRKVNCICPVALPGLAGGSGEASAGPGSSSNGSSRAVLYVGDTSKKLSMYCVML